MQKLNGYKIRYNELFNEWQVSHPEIGRCESFQTKQEAIDYAEKG